MSSEPRRFAVGVIGHNIVIDCGSHDEAMRVVKLVRIDGTDRIAAATPPQPSVGLRAALEQIVAYEPEYFEGEPLLNRLHDHGFTWDDVNALGAILDHEGWVIVPVGTPDNVIAPDSMAVSRMNEAMKSVTASVQGLTDATNRGLRATTDETGGGET